MHGTIGNLSTYEGQRAHYAAVRARLTGIRHVATAPSISSTSVPVPLRIIPDQARIEAAHIARERNYLHGLAMQAASVNRRMFDQAPTLAQIMFETCGKYNVTALDIRSSRRTRDIMIPRQEFYWRARYETEHSLPMIGRFCGGRNHTTILSGVKAHARRAEAKR